MPSSSTPNGPQGPRLAVQTASPSVYRQPTTSSSSPRASFKLARNDSTQSLPVEALEYHTPTRSSTSNGRPASTTPSNSSFSSRSDGQPTLRTRTTEPASSPMFFHASEAKANRPSIHTKPKPPTSSAKFFYADSRATAPLASTTPSRQIDLSPITAPPKLAPLAPKIAKAATLSDRRDDYLDNTKFLHANQLENGGAPKAPRLRAPSPQNQNGTTTKTVKIMSGPLSTSPPKLDASHLSAHSPSAQPIQRQPQARVHLAQSPSQSRRSSIDVSVKRQSRAGSVNAFPFPDVANKALLDIRNNVSPSPSDSIQSPRSPTLAAPIHAQPNAAFLIEQQKELAMNARRERKIMDLEISNTSLLAINKTLERRMRKQTSELRRFKRLSRSGRLILKSNKVSRKSSADTIDAEDAEIVGDEVEDNEEEDEEDEEDEDEDEEEEDEEEEEEEDDDDDADTDPNKVQSDKALARRAKDEKRLALDLAKHQALLDASAKMNSSLKRCQFLAETLIEEAKKSLAYIVRPSEVRLGGRVIESEAETDTEDDDADQRTTDGYSTPTYQESEFGRHSQYSQSEVDGSVSGYSHSEQDSQNHYSQSEGGDYSVSEGGGSSLVDDYAVSPPGTPR